VKLKEDSDCQHFSMRTMKLWLKIAANIDLEIPFYINDYSI